MKSHRTWIRAGILGRAFVALIAVVLFVLSASIGVAEASPARLSAADESALETPGNLHARIHQLIQQLGDEQYAVRQRAHEELRRLGAAAFDALTAVENHEDIEIASRARYLVQVIRVDWVRESDSPQVKEILENYELQDERRRLEMLKQLARLPQDVALEPLCRLVRFEQSPLLSKRGALLVLMQPEPSPKDLPTRDKTIETALADSARPGARWLRTYLQFHDDPLGALDQWDQWTTDELATLKNSPTETELNIVQTLLQQQVEMVKKVGQVKRARGIMKKMVALEKGDPKSLGSLVDWLVKEQAWDLVDEVARRFERTFNADAGLLYALAQARRTQEKNDEAEKIAQRAFELTPNGAIERIEQAMQLQQRGLYEWSEREYREVIAATASQEIEIRASHVARLSLSEMLHDIERHKDAAEVLQELSNLISTDANVRQRIQNMGREPGSIRSRMHFFYACHYEKQIGRDKQAALEQQWKHLDRGISHDQADADVLIGLYRASEGNPPRRKKALEWIARAAELYRGEIADRPDDPTFYNQYAWLIANTEGNFDLALQYSHKSLELQPDSPSLLDTLAHCYAAKGDYENAVKHQTRAAELEPHTMQISRALTRFEAGLEKSRSDEE